VAQPFLAVLLGYAARERALCVAGIRGKAPGADLWVRHRREFDLRLLAAEELFFELWN